MKRKENIDMTISEQTKVTLIKPLDVTDLAGDKVMIDFATGKYYMLKGSAVDIWEIVQTPTTVGEIKAKLMDIYDVDEGECLASITAFLNQMNENKFVTLE